MIEALEFENLGNRHGEGLTMSGMA
jgi:hypothetical protein